MAEYLNKEQHVGTKFFCIAFIALFALLFGSSTWAQEKKSTAQQERMRSCNAQAGQKSLQGRDRQAFMSECLKADAPGKKLSGQQERMKTCNAQANSKDLKGDERKAYISACLKGGPKGSAKGTAQREKMRSCNAQAAKKQMKGEERKDFMSRCLSH